MGAGGYSDTRQNQGTVGRVELIVLIVMSAVALGVTLFLHKFVVPPGARTLILFDAGRARIKRGNVGAQTLQFVEDLLRQAGAKRASVGILPNGTLWLSPSVPEGVHQQLRNILMR